MRATLLLCLALAAITARACMDGMEGHMSRHLLAEVGIDWQRLAQALLGVLLAPWHVAPPSALSANPPLTAS